MKRGGIALSQILILLMGVVAIGYAFGSQTGIVSAAATCSTISGASFEYGGNTYTATTSDSYIHENNGLVYKQIGNQQWQYSSDGGTTWHDVSSVGNDLTTFTYCAQLATANAYSAQPPQQPTTPTTQQPAPAPSDQPPAVTSNSPSGAGNSLLDGCTAQGSSVSDCFKLISGAVSTVGTVKNLVKSVGGSAALSPPALGSAGSGFIYGTAGSTAGSAGGSTAAGIFASLKLGGFWGITGKIVVAAGAALIVHWGLNQLINLIPGLDKNSVGAAWLQLGNAAISGAAGGLVFVALAQGSGSAFVAGGLIGAGIAVVLWAIFYKQHDVKAVQFSCIPWQAPLGGANCDICGENGLPCSAYQCQSLGQNCVLLNSGATGEQLCTTVNVDKNPPTMTFWQATLPDGYSVSPLGASVLSSSGDTGVLVTSSQPDGKVPSYSNLKLGIQTNKPSVCSVSFNSRLPITDSSGSDTFSKLYLMDNGLYLFNHTVQIPSSTPIPTGDMELFIRCHDANSPADYTQNYFIIKFGMNPVEDTSSPVVLGTDLPNKAAIPYDKSSAEVSIYISRPVSGCRWSHTSQTYSDMTNNLNCSDGQTQITNGAYYSISDGTVQPAIGVYSCSANLTGMQNGQDNTYYFRCNGTLGGVNDAANPPSLTLKGSAQSLAITSATPNETLIKGSSDNIKVLLDIKTFGGADGQGTASCYYDLNSQGYSLFGATGSYESTNQLYLPTGDYTIPIKCIDSAGNTAYTTLKFSTLTDNIPPQVVRVYKDNSNLNIVTDENATCVYDTTDCTYLFSDGIPMNDLSGTIHTAPWVTGRTYHIKCEDTFGNMPKSPTACTTIVQPSSI